MSRNFIINLTTLLCLILVQIFICNHIMLFNAATVFIFIYVIINLPMNLNTNFLLTWAFLAGLIVDIFSDTLGINTLSCTVLAMIKQPMLYAYIPKDDRTKNIDPSLKSLGFSVYAKYLLSLSAIYCLLVFFIEYSNFTDIKEILLMSGASTIFTFVILLALDSLIINKRAE